ncbi:MAG: chemotaxis protein CheA [Nitrospinae bacterium]|nr:chemotaxis protein CheA [Nitrospinota bacterium]
MAIDLSRFQETFFEESSEHVETIETGLLQLEHRPEDLELLNQVFRAAHSIKGNSGMFGFTAVGELTHKMENVLDGLRNNEMEVTEQIIDLLLQALDGLKSLLEVARGSGTADEEAIKTIETKLLAYQNGTERERLEAGGPKAEVQDKRATPVAECPVVPARRLVTIMWVPLPELFQRGLDPGRIFQELASLGRIHTLTVNADRLPDLPTMDAEVCYLSWTVELETEKPLKEIDAVFDFVRDESELTIAEPSAPQPPASQEMGEDEHKRLGEILVEEGEITLAQLETSLSKQKRIGEILVEDHEVGPRKITKALEKQHRLDTVARAQRGETTSIRVGTDKIDKLINLVGELVITQSMMANLTQTFTMDQVPLLQERVLELERHSREMQERVMSIRMLPIRTAFRRFPRMVRDLAIKNGKQIQLVMSGEETQLDKTVIEAIIDPLTHLIRNSADHGIEPPEERVARGKPVQGTIKLDAFHEGGNIRITVEDDGQGLNWDKILAKAKQLGMVAEGEPLGKKEVWQLIFRPGFSTAEKVTDLSGRGVGMDVVKRNIESLGGTVGVQTREGQGTKFMIKLPLTLAIIEGMTVRIGREGYIVPLVSIIESVRPTKDMMKTIVGKGEVVSLRNMFVPVIRLYDLFAIEAEFTNPVQGVLVLVEAEGTKVALMVDELVGQQQVVIKSLEKNFQKVEGLAGATILGNGEVAFILDVPGLISLAKNGSSVLV